MQERHGEAGGRLGARGRPAVDDASAVSLVYDERKRAWRTRAITEENAPVIPQGSFVWFRTADLAEVAPGSYVFVRRDGDTVARRVVRIAETPAGPELHLATAAGGLEPPQPAGSLFGVIIEVQVGDRLYDPAREPLVKAVRNFLTDYDTCSPVAKVARLVAAMLPPSGRLGR